jgi:dTDP-4-dehydrorhamnose reductase
MKVLITGGGGQLGRALTGTCPGHYNFWAPDRSELNILSRESVRSAISEFCPALVLNTAAYTAVDKAETDVQAARKTNADAVGWLAAETAAVGAKFVHVSTDFVFDGAAGVPYSTDSAVNPLNVYGQTKLEGELQALMQGGTRTLIVRTAWVYGPSGANFVNTMLSLMSSKSHLTVVDDQIGTPTLVTDLANAIWALAALDCTGIYHYTNSGVASWYDFALAIQEEALALALLNKEIPVHPVSSSQFVRAARRPGFSVLDKSKTAEALGQSPEHWRIRLRTMLKGFPNNG